MLMLIKTYSMSKIREMRVSTMRWSYRAPGTLLPSRLLLSQIDVCITGGVFPPIGLLLRCQIATFSSAQSGTNLTHFPRLSTRDHKPHPSRAGRQVEVTSNLLCFIPPSPWKMCSHSTFLAPSESMLQHVYFLPSIRTS